MPATLVLYFPAEQDMHVEAMVWPVPVLYLPALHEVHDAKSGKPVPVLYVPAGHVAWAVPPEQ